MELTKEYFEQHLDERLSQLASKLASKTDLEEISEKLDALSTRDIEDSDAFAKDITKLKKQIAIVTKRVKQLELKLS
jgi:tRNA(Ser,Leu) C12 N-acetylase TAN1